MGYLAEFGLAIGGTIPSGVFIIGSATQGIIGTNTIGTFDMLADYSSRLQSINTQRTSDRTTRTLIGYNAGTATVKLLNMDGELDPYALEQAGLTAPGVIMRLRYVAADSTIYPVFWGYVDSWDPLADSPEVGTVTVSATDGFVLLNQKLGPLGSPVGANESVHDRVVRMLDAMGYSATLRSLGSTSEILQATSFDDNGLALIQQAVEAEVGEFYQQPDGVMFLRGRQAIVTDTRSATSQATFGSNRGAGEIPYVGRPVTSWNKLGMHNRVVAQIDGSTNPQIAEDAAAVSLYGTEYTIEETTLKLTTDASALSWANFVLAGDVKPTFQFSGITLNSALEQLVTGTTTTTITDTFTRGNSTSTLGSTESPVLAWTADNGTWGISSNQAYVVTAGGFDSRATIPVGVANQDVSAVLTTGDIAIMASYVDGSNYYKANIAGAAIDVKRVQGGSETSLSGAVGSWSSGSVLRLVTNDSGSGTQVTAYIGATQVYTGLDTTAGRPAGTRAGLRDGTGGTPGTPRFDNFTVVYTAATAASTIAQQFGRKLGDRVTVVRRPPATPYGSIVDSRELYIQGISHAWDTASKQTLTTFDLIPVSKFPAFVIGSATQGVIGQNTIGW